AREPLADTDRLDHRISPLLRAGRAAALPAVGILRATAIDPQGVLRAMLDGEYYALRADMVDFNGEPAEFVRLVTLVEHWEFRALLLGPLDADFPGRSLEIHDLYTQMAEKAIHEIHTRCVTDVSSIAQLPTIADLAALKNLAVENDLNDAMR